MIDINYDESSKEFYLFFQGKRYSITGTEITNLKEKLNSLKSHHLSSENNENQNLL